MIYGVDTTVIDDVETIVDFAWTIIINGVDTIISDVAETVIIHGVDTILIEGAGTTIINAV